MDKTEKRRAFIIRFLYLAIWAGLIYCLLKYAMPLFMPFVIAFGIAFILKPLINRISSRTRLSRKLTSILLLVLFYLVIGSLVTLIVVRLVIFFGNWFADLPRLYREYIQPAIEVMGNPLDGLLVSISPDLVNFFETAGDALSDTILGILNSISSWAVGMLGSMASSVPWFVVGTVLCIIASFFFTVDYYKITGFVVTQLTERGRRLLFTVKDFVVGTLFRFARAYGILMFITFCEVSIGLLILRVPNAFAIAFFVAIVDILPVFGTGTVLIPWAVYNLFTGNLFWGIGLAVIYAVITIIRQVLEPRVVGAQIGLYPLLTLICMFIGARMFGFWGMFGFPVTLVILIYLNRIGEISWFKDPRGPLPPGGPQHPQKGPGLKELFRRKGKKEKTDG